MPVKPNDFLDFAKGISTKNEIGVRNAVSRAYYAMYTHAAHTYGLLCRKDSSLKKKGSHERMAEYLKHNLPRDHNYPQSNCEELSLQLTKVKLRRHAADYRLHEKMNESEGSEAISAASKFISLMDKLAMTIPVNTK
ncbi:hypothetical protein [Rouxiella sp. WC2420]|uniref:HEPN domain-containing protein n=1 Tax=Rouxiella sp. WC2420 TaxID=3234145 RepID=A0AB39VMB7_9GAMM